MAEKIVFENFPKNETQFDHRFCCEQDCDDYLFELRWPNGFFCSYCGNTHYWKSARDLFICTHCRQQQSITAGTIFQGTKKPLRAWFKAMWWFTTRKTGVNAVNLKELLGLGSYRTAWTWLHKLRSCTIRQPREQLSEFAEADEIYIGGEHSGKRDRGAMYKCAIAVAVERKGKSLGRLRLQVIDNCSSDQFSPFIESNVAIGSRVETDGWKGYGDLKSLGYDHRQILQSKAADKQSVLSGVHLVTSLVKRVITGTFQGRFEKKYLQGYLNEYVFRFNRRSCKYVGKKFMRIVEQAIVTPPLTYNQVSLGTMAPSSEN